MFVVPLSFTLLSSVFFFFMTDLHEIALKDIEIDGVISN